MFATWRPHGPFVSSYVMSMAGDLIQTLTSDKREGGDFVMCTVTSQGTYLYCVAEDSKLYCFEIAGGKIAHQVKVHDKDVIGLAVHPYRNLVATWADEGTLKLWRAS